MPTADHLIPGLDDVDLEQAPPAEEDLTWPPTAPKKSKKKKKATKYVDANPPPPEGEEDMLSGVPITGAQPTEGHGGRMQGGYDEPVGQMEGDHRLPDEQADKDFGNTFSGHEGNGFAPPPATFASEDSARGAEATPPVQKRASLPPPPSIPSPRLAPARPAVPSSLTPPSRPASLYSPQPQFAQPGSHRPTNNVMNQARRSSRSSPSQRFVEPVAPPHMSQPHFYGLPDLSRALGKKKEVEGKAPGSGGYCCCFDSFADSGDLASARKAKTALLVGSEGGLEVYRVLPNKVEVVGRLEGLRGGIIGAKILPCVGREDDLKILRPLVAVIVHGVADDDGVVGDNDEVPATRYQTTVEIYSLQTQEYVATLFKSATVTLEQPTIGHLSTVPGPIGDLSVAAHGTFLTVTSGKSGEVFVFTHKPTTTNTETQFRCIGKFWTTLQSSLDRPISRSASASEGAQTADESDHKSGVPLVSLSPRWLAIVPPTTSSHISIQGTALLSDYNPTAPGLASHVAPPQPSITCDIAGVDAEGTFSRLTRQTAQGLVRYSQKGFELGMQGWNELVNPTNPTGLQHTRGSSKDDQFPPTKAPPEDARRQTREPAVVSIIDLEVLLDAEELRPKYPPAPMATFALEEGCNHLSLSSTGLRLLTVSQTGETWSAWDLKQASHGIVHYTTAKNDDAIYSPCVKQILRIPRNTQAIVVESSWSKDDEYLAILTTHGTVHLHEVPLHPPSRKRKRRSTPSTSAPEKAEPTTSISPGMSPPSSNNLLGSLRSGWQSVSTQVSTLNPVSSLGIPTSLAGLRDTAASAGQAGGRALARGLSQSYSAARSGATEYLHADDNKIRHKPLQQQQTQHQDVVAGGGGVLRWVKRQSGMLLAVAAGGTVHLHPVARVERARGEAVVRGLKHDRYGMKKFELPPIRTTGLSERGGVARQDDCVGAGPHGFWSLRMSAPLVGRDGGRKGSGVPVPALVPRGGRQPPAHANEVETNPPYCPFHIDSRVNVFAFDEEEDKGTGSAINLGAAAISHTDALAAFLSQGHHEPGEKEGGDVWVFGEPLPASTKMNTHEVLTFDKDGFHDDGVTDSDMEALAEQVESRFTFQSASEAGGGEEIRVHTTLQRGGGRGQEAAEEYEFEYDDDE